MNKVQDLISKTKAALVLEQPFIASLLINMPMQMREDIPTMATDGKGYFYNPAFIEKLSMDNLKFVLAHEVFHCVHQHMYRKGERDHRRWNQAGDYVINNMLIQEKIGVMPQGGLHDPQLVLSGGGTTDGVYDLLPPSKNESNAQQDAGDPLDDCMDAPGEEAQQAADSAQMKVRVAQAAQAAKMCGKLSAGMALFAGECLRPVVRWEDVTRKFWMHKARTDYSFARPKRRFIDMDIYLPTLTGEKLGEVVLFVDCSGSIDAATLGKFATEIRTLQQDCSPERLHVMYFDTEVSHHDTFESDDEIHIEAHGGGGTAFSPLWQAVLDKGINPVCALVLTDLCCSDFGVQPDYPVLWVATQKGNAPFGEIVMMEDRR